MKIIKKSSSRKLLARKRWLAALVLAAIFMVVTGYNVTLAQSLKDFEENEYIEFTHIEKIMMPKDLGMGPFRVGTISSNDHTGVMAVHEFSLLKGWRVSDGGAFNLREDATGVSTVQILFQNRKHGKFVYIGHVSDKSIKRIVIENTYTFGVTVVNEKKVPFSLSLESGKDIDENGDFMIVYEVESKKNEHLLGYYRGEVSAYDESGNEIFHDDLYMDGYIFDRLIY